MKPDNYIREIKNKPIINETIGQGITQTTINNALNTNQYTLNQQLTQLFTPLVTDKDLLQLLITEENLNKLTTRFEYRINLKNNTTTIAKTATFNKTPQRVINELQNTIDPKEQIKKKKYDLRQANCLQKLQEQNYHKATVENDGYINTAEVQIIFRKAS